MSPIDHLEDSMRQDTREILTAVKYVARNRFAWPGGYPLVVLLTDGECLCPACARAKYRAIVDSTVHGLRDGWAATAAFIHQEGAPIICAHCNAAVESAYGDPDAEQEIDKS